MVCVWRNWVRYRVRRIGEVEVRRGDILESLSWVWCEEVRRCSWVGWFERGSRRVLFRGSDFDSDVIVERRGAAEEERREKRSKAISASVSAKPGFVFGFGWWKMRRGL